MTQPVTPTAPVTENLPAESAPVIEQESLDPGWPHDRLELFGDRLAVRAPTYQALAGFSLSSSKYVPDEVKNDMTGLFISEHLAPESYGRIMQRLMDPDDPDYTTETIGTIMREIVDLTIERSKSSDEG